MNIDFKNLNIGQLIQTRVDELNIKMSRICNFFRCTETDINEMYKRVDLPSDLLLKWSKLLEYDFFRLYSQHLILFSPPRSNEYSSATVTAKSQLPQFRKHVYTKEIIEFILETITAGEKTKNEVMRDYKIPKATLYKWIDKYQK
ncbi:MULTISPECIES: transposase [Chryseobacterium]|uniref:transposase n=1 Tax=Chryseobacterium TaxID=59732 RepID=UPI000AC3E488|nr:MULTISPECIES: transposase [Chryseobacterium]VFA41436.1 Uncharacterised protein [Chryseobacterium indologenes]